MLLLSKSLSLGLSRLSIELLTVLLLHRLLLLNRLLGIVLAFEESLQLLAGLGFGLEAGEVRVVLGQLGNHLRRGHSWHCQKRRHRRGRGSLGTCSCLLLLLLLLLQLLLLQLLLLLKSLLLLLQLLLLGLSVTHNGSLDSDRVGSGCRCRGRHRVEQRGTWDNSGGHNRSAASLGNSVSVQNLLRLGVDSDSTVIIVEGSAGKNRSRWCGSSGRVS